MIRTRAECDVHPTKELSWMYIHVGECQRAADEAKRASWSPVIGHAAPYYLAIKTSHEYIISLDHTNIRNSDPIFRTNLKKESQVRTTNKQLQACKTHLTNCEKKAVEEKFFHSREEAGIFAFLRLLELTNNFRFSGNNDLLKILYLTMKCRKRRRERKLRTTIVQQIPIFPSRHYSLPATHMNSWTVSIYKEKKPPHTRRPHPQNAINSHQPQTR